MSEVLTDTRPANALYQFLTHISGASASADLTMLAVSGAPTAQAVFGYTCTANKAAIMRINWLIIDDTQSPTKFGGVTGLANGLKVETYDADGNAVLDFMDGRTLQKNADFVFLAGSDNPIAAAAGDDAFECRWTLANGVGPRGLTLHSGESIRVTVQDDLTPITEFRAQIQGRTTNY